MIASFRHKGLRQLFEQDDRSKLRQDQLRRIQIILAALDQAESLEDLNRPSFKLHPLKGARAGYWSIWVNGNWRIIFQMAEGQVTDVDLLDYH